MECIRAYIVKAFCPDAPMNARQKYLAMNQTRKYASVIIALAVVFGIWLTVTVINDITTSYVSDSVWSAYDANATVGSVFDDYFDDTKWSWYREDSNTYVKFSGKFSYWGEPTKAEIVFEVNWKDGYYHFDHVKIDGEENDLVGLIVIQDAYNSYRK